MTAAAMPPGKMPGATTSSSRGSPRHRPKARNTASCPAPRCAPPVTPAWGKSLQAHLYETARASIYCSDVLKAASKPGESEGDFRARLNLAMREKRDAAVAELRKRWQDKLLKLQDQIRRAEERHEREQAQLSQQKMQTAVSIGSSILGALLGRKAISATNVGRVGTAARSAGRWGRESQDVDRGGREHRRSPAATRGYPAGSGSRNRRARDHARCGDHHAATGGSTGAQVGHR